VDPNNQCRRTAEPGLVRTAGYGQNDAVVTSDDVRKLSLSMPRAYEALVRDRVKFRVGQYVFVTLSRDETVMGFGYRKEERAALVAAEPDKFHLPDQASMRYNWLCVRLGAIDHDELRELVVEAWRFVVSKKVFQEYVDSH
jgi:hypothetical protein